MFHASPRLIPETPLPGGPGWHLLIRGIKGCKLEFSSTKTVKLLTYIAALFAFIATMMVVNFIDGNYRKAALMLIMGVLVMLSIQIGGALHMNFLRDAAELSKSPGSGENSDVIAEMPIANAEVVSWDGFDPDEDEYPRELDIALQAWRAVRNSNNGGPIKPQIENWVRTNYRDIKSNAEIDRISIIANWSTGGRPAKRLENSSSN